MTKIDVRMLDKAIGDWETNAPIEDIIDATAFRKFMLDKYGINVGAFMNQCSIVDEKKYLMFILRWS